MRILIGYDGSDWGEAAIRDLRRAGLPAVCEAVVMTVADVFVPPPFDEAIDNTFPMYVPEGVRRAHEHAQAAVSKARDLALRGQQQVEKLFPRWLVRSEACADSPAAALIRWADEWEPDLIVVGSHGHTTLGGRLILGSVSQGVLYGARHSVRVARGRVGSDDVPGRIIIGMDGSPGSQAALDAVAARAWPSGSEVRLLTFVDTVMSAPAVGSQSAIVKWFESENENDLISLREIFEGLADKLRSAGLTTSVSIKKGNPKHALVEEAVSWNADAIFVGAKGVRAIDRLLLGSVSAAVAARAQCSVEVVRPKQVA